MELDVNDDNHNSSKSDLFTIPGIKFMYGYKLEEFELKQTSLKQHSPI